MMQWSEESRVWPGFEQEHDMTYTWNEVQFDSCDVKLLRQSFIINEDEDPKLLQHLFIIDEDEDPNDLLLHSFRINEDENDYDLLLHSFSSDEDEDDDNGSDVVLPLISSDDGENDDSGDVVSPLNSSNDDEDDNDDRLLFLFAEYWLSSLFFVLLQRKQPRGMRCVAFDYHHHIVFL
jgi:hypothetical protein